MAGGHHCTSCKVSLRRSSEIRRQHLIATLKLSDIRNPQMDIASIGGILLAIIGILAGMMIEGGSIAQITQPTAAMIVVGGTAGAVMLQFPMHIFLAACKDLVKVFMHKGPEGEAVLAQLVAFANKARKSGIVSLDQELGKIEDPFLK